MRLDWSVSTRFRSGPEDGDGLVDWLRSCMLIWFGYEHIVACRSTSRPISPLRARLWSTGSGWMSPRVDLSHSDPADRGLGGTCKLQSL